jgi:hypothetical protein
MTYLECMFRRTVLTVLLVVTGIAGVTQPSPGSIRYRSHPRILLDTKSEGRIRSLIESNQSFKRIHSIILNECEKILQEPPVAYELVGRRLLKNCRELRRRIFYLAYAWRMTNDGRFLVKAEKELLTVSAFPDWNPSHFLDVAEMTMGVAIGYDWLYPGLSVRTKEKLRTAILEMGLEPSEDSRYNEWLKANHNWNQVCNAGMTFGALAVLESSPEIAHSIIERSTKSVMLAMDQYKPDGGYPEGYGYWMYGTTFNVLMIDALKKSIGNDFQNPCTREFLNTAYFFQHLLGPSGKGFNYSDSDDQRVVNPAMFWFARELHDNSLLYDEIEFIKTAKNLHRARELPALLIWGSKLENEIVGSPSQKVWIGRGNNPVAMMRTSWRDPNAFYVGVKAGSPSFNHGHMDIGSFVLDALGERWVVDLGTQNYNGLESKGLDIWSRKQKSDRWKVYRFSNLSHNTLTINGGLQRADATAKFVHSSEAENFMHCVMDLSSIYEMTSVKRGVALIDKEYVLIQDELVLESSGVVKWNIVTPAVVKLINKTTAELSINGKTLFVTVQSPSNVSLKTYSTKPPNTFDQANNGMTALGFEITVPENKPVRLCVVFSKEVPEKPMAILPMEKWPSMTSK